MPSFHAGISDVVVVDQTGTGSFKGSVHSNRGSFLEPIAQGSIRHNGWLQTAALLAAAILGTGVLALPANYAKLGWVLGVAAMVACYPLNFFTGYLLNRLHLEYPSVLTMGDLGQRVMGKPGAVVGYGGLYVLLFFILGNYFAVLGNSVIHIFYDSGLCLPQASLITLVLTIPTNQLQTLYYVSFLSVVSCVTIVSVVVITVVFLVGPGESSCSTEPVPAPGFMVSLGAFSGFFFAYSAQQLFLEMQAEMKEPRHFPRTLHVALTGMITIYMGISLIAYRACGDHTPGMLTDVVPKGPWLRTVGVLMLVHMLVSYTISQQIFTRGILCLVGAMRGLEQDCCGRLTWFASTTLLAGGALVIANAIPKFDDLVNLIGALLIVPLCFMLPIVFYLAHRWKSSTGQIGVRDGLMLVACWGVLIVSAFLWVTGTVSAVNTIRKDTGGSGKPFGCHGR